MFIVLIKTALFTKYVFMLIIKKALVNKVTNEAKETEVQKKAER